MLDSQRPTESATVPQKNWGIETANDLTPYADRKQVLIVILIVLEKFLKE